MVHIRTDREIDLIAASCQIVADTLEMLSEHVVPGAKITDLDKLLKNLLYQKALVLLLRDTWAFLPRYAFL